MWSREQYDQSVAKYKGSDNERNYSLKKIINMERKRMRNEILKRLISSISATTLAATSLGLNTVLAANAENTNPVANVNETEELTEELCHDHECEEYDHDDCCDHSHGGKGVTIALLDAGVTNFETAGKTSFIDDATIGSDHGNDMMNIISDVAPEADVLDVRVLDDEGHGTYSTVEKGIRWSVDNNADIIVMSFVGENQSSLLEDALAYAEEHEVLVVASAGNYSDNKALYPAAYPTVISVGALDENGKIQDYSNFGYYNNQLLIDLTYTLFFAILSMINKLDLL